MGYQKFLLDLPDALFIIQKQLRDGSFAWHDYRKIIVCDPKRREILAAPFRDRIVHQAICQVIGPAIDAAIPGNSFACRKGMGNRRAAESLAGILQALGPERYALKLDVRQYFASIRHDLLFQMVSGLLPDRSADGLLQSLLKSHRDYAGKGRGIPIGNVSSQAFANLFLSPLDHLAAADPEVFYVRYMDDMVLCGQNKESVRRLERNILDMAHDNLDLEIPYNKRIQLGQNPVPFLGYVLDHAGYRILARNRRRFRNRLRTLAMKGLRESSLAQIEASYRAWEILDFEKGA